MESGLQDNGKVTKMLITKLYFIITILSLYKIFIELQFEFYNSINATSSPEKIIFLFNINIEEIDELCKCLSPMNPQKKYNLTVLVFSYISTAVFIKLYIENFFLE